MMDDERVDGTQAAISAISRSASTCRPSKRREVRMPNDPDGSGLTSLIWAICIYWNLSWWIGYLSRLQGTTGKRLQNGTDSSISTCPFVSAAATHIPPAFGALLTEIFRYDGEDTIDEFLRNRRLTYETIVAAFNCGDRHKLRTLVSTEVYEVFSEAIGISDSLRTGVETIFSQVQEPEIVMGIASDSHIEVSIRFVSEFFKIVHGGSRTASETIEKHRSVDVWTFRRPTLDRKSQWQVVATEAGVMGTAAIGLAA
jgi:predicted lipid-binding transport protein (Tim44 family)